MPFGECHNRYTHEVVPKFQSQRRRLREILTLLPQLPPAVLQLSMEVASYGGRLAEGKSSDASSGLEFNFFLPCALIFAFNFNLKFNCFLY